ncbi:MAG: hypothetical protein ACK5LF_21320 [Bacteroides xylanisolvens]
MIEVKTIDKDQINFLIRELEQFEKNKAIKSGLQAGGRVFVTEGKKRLRQRLKNPKGYTGNLLESFTVRVKRNKPGVLSGFKRSSKNMIIGGGNHAHLVNQGTKKRKTKSGVNRGVMPANYFWTDTESIDYNKAIEKVFLGVAAAVNKINGLG